MSRNKRSQRTREEILDSAWDLIAERGASVSMSQIATAAGITRQSVYLHFGSRGGLLLALVVRADVRFKIWQAFTDAFASEDPRIRLQECLQAWLDFVPKIHPVARDLIRLSASDGDAAAAWNGRMDELLEFFEKLVASLKEEQVLKEHWTVRGATDFLWVSCSVSVWDLLVKNRRWGQEQAEETIKKTICEALLKT